MKPVIKKNIADSFSAQYLNYQSAATFHEECADSLLSELKALVLKEGFFLEIGSHTGVMSSKLQGLCATKKMQSIRIDLQSCGESLITAEDNAKFLKADGEALPFSENVFQCIVSNATFQWFSEWETSLQKIMKCLKVDGHLVFSQFINPSLEPLKSWYREIERPDAFIDLVDFDKLKELLSSYETCKVLSLEKELYFTDLKELFGFLKMMGVNAPSKNLNRLTKSQTQKLKMLSEKSRLGKGIPLKLCAAIVVITK